MPNRKFKKLTDAEYHNLVEKYREIHAPSDKKQLKQKQQGLSPLVKTPEMRLDEILFQLKYISNQNIRILEKLEKMHPTI